MLKVLFTLLISCFITAAYADNANRPLPAEEAFVLTVKPGGYQQLLLDWKIAPGYYLYRDKIQIKAPGKIGAISLPKGEIKQDEVNGVFQAYTRSFQVAVPLASTQRGDLQLKVDYQGCSSSGFCYPPIKKNLTLNLSSLKITAEPAATDQSYATQLLAKQQFIFIIIGFLGLGLLLAFTPCVLPMLPILSSIIVGQGRNVTTKKSFLLSLTYVLGMALAYAFAGIALALVGSNIQITLQKPAVIVVFSGLFVFLALSLFGFYEVRMPNGMHQRVMAWSQRHEGGTYVGVFFMGVLSSLILSPCVSAPLVGALAYIAKSGDVILGFSALLALGLGMGIPLLLIGASAGKFLPRAGKWMDKIKQFFGILMLAVAVWTLERILPGAVILFLWSLLAVGTAVFLWYLQHTQKFWRHLKHGVGLLVLSYGFILMGGAIQGHSDPFYPWAYSAEKKLSFVTVKNMAQLEEQLAKAKQNKQSVMLDFYADWCAACVVMDKHVFNQVAIKRALSKFVLLRADVTQNNEFDQSLLKRFKVVAPPTMLFFTEQARPDEIVGEVSAKELLAKLERVDIETKQYCQTTRSC